jgi:hypothetical protein
MRPDGSWWFVTRRGVGMIDTQYVTEVVRLPEGFVDFANPPRGMHIGDPNNPDHVRRIAPYVTHPTLPPRPALV